MLKLLASFSAALRSFSVCRQLFRLLVQNLAQWCRVLHITKNMKYGLISPSSSHYQTKVTRQYFAEFFTGKKKKTRQDLAEFFTRKKKILFTELGKIFSRLGKNIYKELGTIVPSSSHPDPNLVKCIVTPDFGNMFLFPHYF